MRTVIYALFLLIFPVLSWGQTTDNKTYTLVSNTEDLTLLVENVSSYEQIEIKALNKGVEGISAILVVNPADNKEILRFSENFSSIILPVNILTEMSYSIRIVTAESTIHYKRLVLK